MLKKVIFMLLLISVIASCRDNISFVSPTSTPTLQPTVTVASPLPSATSTSPFQPAVTKTMTIPAPTSLSQSLTLTPTSQLSLERLEYVKMLGPDEGWIAVKRYDGTFLYYTIQPGDVEPQWYGIDSKQTPSEDPLLWDVFDIFRQGNKIFMLNRNEGWKAGQRGSIAHYYNNEWHNIIRGDIRSGDRLNAIAAMSHDNVWAAGDAWWHYDGQSWQQVSDQFPRNQHVHAIEVISETEMWAGGEWLHHYKDGQWEHLPILEDLEGYAIIRSISMISPDEGWAAGDNILEGFILHYHNQTWEVTNRFPNTVLSAIDMVNAEDGWIVGVEYQEGLTGPHKPVLLRYQDGVWQSVAEKYGFK